MLGTRFNVRFRVLVERRAADESENRKCQVTRPTATARSRNRYNVVFVIRVRAESSR